MIKYKNINNIIIYVKLIFFKQQEASNEESDRIKKNNI